MSNVGAGGGGAAGILHPEARWAGEPSTVMTWMGRPLTDMTREELIEALKITSDQLQSHYTPTAITARALGSVEMMKRGRGDSVASPVFDWFTGLRRAQQRGEALK